MRILHVIPSLAARDGGTTNAVVGMSREMLRKGEDAEIYTTNADGPGYLNVPAGRRLLVRDVPVTYFPVTISNYYKVSFQLGAALRAAIPRFDIVHVHALYQYPSSAGVHYSRKMGIPYIVSPHGSLDPFLYRHHRPRKWLYEVMLERRNLGGAAAVHFTSKEEMELASSLGLRFRGLVAPLGVDLEFPPGDWERIVNCAWPELDGKRVVLFLGRVNFVKGLAVLIQAFSRVRRLRQDLHLVVAGPDNEGYGAQLRNWLKREGYLSSVTFTGLVQGDTKAALLKRAQVFALPSYTESFGIVVVEAMGAGVPIAISNRVKIRREIQEVRAGLVADPDVDQFARIILTILDDPAAAREMGQRGYRLAHDRFSWEAAGENICQLYRHAVSDSIAGNHRDH